MDFYLGVNNMFFFNDTVTLYYQIGTPFKPKYQKQILNNVYLEKSFATDMNLIANEPNNSSTLYISKNLKNYLDKNMMSKTDISDKHKYWTIEEGDFVVEGICNIENINSSLDLENEDIYTIVHINDFLKNSPLLHLEVSLK